MARPRRCSISSGRTCFRTSARCRRSSAPTTQAVSRRSSRPGPSPLIPPQLPPGLGFLALLNDPFFQTTQGLAERRALEAFVLAFDTNFLPIVGQQVTLGPRSGADAHARLDLLQAQAAVVEPRAACDLIASGRSDKHEIGYLYAPESDSFTSSAGGAPIADAALRSKARKKGAELTFTCVPPGSGHRQAIDRDRDGYGDTIEAEAGSDPADPDSTPDGARTIEASDRRGACCRRADGRGGLRNRGAPCASPTRRPPRRDTPQRAAAHAQVSAAHARVAIDDDAKLAQATAAPRLAYLEQLEATKRAFAAEARDLAWASRAEAELHAAVGGALAALAPNRSMDGDLLVECRARHCRLSVPIPPGLAVAAVPVAAEMAMALQRAATAVDAIGRAVGENAEPSDPAQKRRYAFYLRRHEPSR